MNILIIGGNRFVGASLVKKLLGMSLKKVTIFNRRVIGDPRAIIIQGNRNNPRDLAKINFKEFDYIIDMCLFKPDQFELIKPFLLEADLKKYVFISSAAVGIEAFGDYAKEKEEVENLIKQTDLKYEIISPVYIVGENSHRPRLGYYINQLEAEDYINIDEQGNYFINLIHVDDVVDFILEYTFSEATYKTYILSNGEDLKPIDIINQISLFLKKDKIKLNLNSNDSPFFNQSFVFDKFPLTSKSLNEILPEYMEWFKLNKSTKYGY